VGLNDVVVFFNIIYKRLSYPDTVQRPTNFFFVVPTNTMVSMPLVPLITLDTSEELQFDAIEELMHNFIEAFRLFSL
jgi:hypothetical protein